MAITIDGTAGTIAGLVAGGLPDGCVDADTLAGNAVTSAKILDGTIANSDINASAAIAASKLSGTGKVLQVVSTIKTDLFTTSATTRTDITGLSASITPTSASSKILVLIHIGSIGNQSSGSVFHIVLDRNGSEIGSGSGGGDTNAAMLSYTDHTSGSVAGQVTYLDSPASTSSQTYKVQTFGNTGTTVINRIAANTNHGAMSSITLMEIGA